MQQQQQHPQYEKEDQADLSPLAKETTPAIAQQSGPKAQNCQHASPAEEVVTGIDNFKRMSSIETSDGSELLGDQFLEGECDPDILQQKIMVARDDIDNLRARLKSSSSTTGLTRVSSPNPPPQAKKANVLHLDFRNIEAPLPMGPGDTICSQTLTDAQTDDSYSLPTCFEPKRTVGAGGNKLGVLSLNSGSASTPQSRKALAAKSHSELLKQELEIVEAAERAEQRVREGLEKMKKGLADSKRVKLTIEKQRKTHASESPKPKEAPIPSLFNFRLFSWLQK